MPYTTEQIRQRVTQAATAYNRSARPDARIVRVTLFGSYADGRATDSSDVGLLVRFSAPVVSLLTLAETLETMEEALNTSVDIVQDPMPEDALPVIDNRVPIYEAA